MANLTGTTTAGANDGRPTWRRSTLIDALAATSQLDNASTTPGTTGSGTVDTGKAYSSANTFNQVNSTNVGGTSVFMLFHVSSNWTGSTSSVCRRAFTVATSTVPGRQRRICRAYERRWRPGAPAAAQLLAKIQLVAIPWQLPRIPRTVVNNVDVSADTGEQ
jgi:hypothetical protein